MNATKPKNNGDVVDVSGLDGIYRSYKRLCAKGHIAVAFGALSGNAAHYFCPACLSADYGTVELPEGTV